MDGQPSKEKTVKISTEFSSVIIAGPASVYLNGEFIGVTQGPVTASKEESIAMELGDYENLVLPRRLQS